MTTKLKDRAPVIAMMPDDSFAKFPSMSTARAMLLPERHGFIFTGPHDFKTKHSKEFIEQIYNKLDGRDGAIKPHKRFKDKGTAIAAAWPLIERHAVDKSRLFKHPPVGAVRNDDETTVEKSVAEGDTVDIPSPTEELVVNKEPPKKRVGKLVARGYLPQHRPTDLVLTKHWNQLPPQAKICIITIAEEAYDPKEDCIDLITEEQAQKAIMRRRDELKTRQDPWRIFQYYRSKLTSYGYLRMS